VLELCINRNIYPLFSGGLQHGRLLPQPRGINPTPPLLEGLGNQNQIFSFPGPNTYPLVSVPLAVMLAVDSRFLGSIFPISVSHRSYLLH
jgi:hypothetical protein